MLLNCGVGETLESPLDCKEIKPVNPKEDQSWVFIGRTDAEAEAPVLWPPDAKSWLIRKDPDAGERLKAEGKGDNRGRMLDLASQTQWIWVWVSSGRWQRTGKPGVLQSMGSQSWTQLNSTNWSCWILEIFVTQQQITNTLPETFIPLRYTFQDSWKLFFKVGIVLNYSFWGSLAGWKH